MLVPVTMLETRKTINVSLSYPCPPIPCRNYDVCAIEDGCFDASFEGSDENGDHWSGSPQGAGATETEAILDLIEQLEAE